MIQRIQSIYLLLAAVLTGGLSFVFNLWKDGESLVFAIDKPVTLALFLASAIMSLVAIFMFKNRKSQFVMGRLNIILNFILLIVIVYQSTNPFGGAETPEKSVGFGFGTFLPIISIVMLVLANKAIKKDEDLIKSVDRLR